MRLSINIPPAGEILSKATTAVSVMKTVAEKSKDIAGALEMSAKVVTAIGGMVTGLGVAGSVLGILGSFLGASSPSASIDDVIALMKDYHQEEMQALRDLSS